MSTRTVAAAALLAGALLFALGCGGDSADEWKIVFPAARDGDWAMYVVDQAGGTPVRIAAADGPIFEPYAPSPDGRKLILPNYSGLVVMNSDGSGLRRLAAGDYGTAVWSSDSKKIVFGRSGPGGFRSGLLVIGADGRGERRLTHNASDDEAAWSPGGKSVAFTRRGTGVLLVDPDGTDLRMLWRSRGTVKQLHWPSDGRSLTFLHSHRSETDHGAESDLVTISVADGRVLRRIHRVDPLGRIAWSPDGERIAYWADDLADDRKRFPLVVMNADGSDRRSVADGWDPVWSPDGATIVYIGRDVTGGDELRSIRPDGTGMRRLTRVYPNGVEPDLPAWLRGPVTPTLSPYRLVASRRPNGAVLQIPFPVVELVASGSRVALVSPQRVWAPIWVSTPPLVLWDAERGRTSRLSLATCDSPQSLAILDDGVAFDCSYGHVGFGRSIRVFPSTRSSPYELAHGYVFERPVRLPGRAAGTSDLLVFSTSRRGGNVSPEPQLWRVDGSRKVLIVSGPDAAEPAAVDRGRIAVERADGQVVLLRRDGRVLGRVAPGGQPPSPRYYDFDPPTVSLSGHDLVVLRDGRLRWYDTRSFRLPRSWRVHRGAKLASVSDGLVAYVVGADVHILRLRDGRTTTIRTTSRSAVKASITSAGLFYALHTRPTPRFQSPRFQLTPFRPNPATVVYLRRGAILRQLG